MTPDNVNQIAIRVAEIMAENVNSNPLTDEERQWVRLAIKKEGQSIAFRTAVIEKTTGGLILVLFSAIGYFMLDWAKSHGFKP